MQKSIVFIKMYSFQPSQSGLFWYGMFSSLHVLLGVTGYKNSHDCLYFDVLCSGQLHSIIMEDKVVSQGSMLSVRILWKNDKKWMLNPHPNDINNLSELWVYESPLTNFCGIPINGNGKTYQHKEC